MDARDRALAHLATSATIGGAVFTFAGPSPKWRLGGFTAAAIGVVVLCHFNVRNDR